MNVTQPGLPTAIWPEAKTDILRALWASGVTCAQIGKTMGITRNAVIGKVHRLKMQLRRVSPVKRATPTTKHARKAPPSLPTIMAHKAPRLPKPRPEPIPAPVGMAGVGLFDRTGCAYPINDGPGFLFCNHVTGGGSYCQYHKQIMYTPGSLRMKGAGA